MAENKGMNAQQVRAYSNSIEGQLGMLDHAQGSVVQATLVSNNPLEYLLDPGSLIVAPWSIYQLTTANAEITLAKGSARELVAKLLAEATAQEFVSNDTDASYVSGFAWKTPDAQDIPDVNPWDFLGGVVSTGKTLLEGLGTIAGYVETGLEWALKYGPEAAKKFSDWWDTLPPWAQGLKKVGRALPWIGTGFSAAEIAAEFASGEPDGWQLLRHGVSIGLDIASAAATGTIVGAPAGLVLAGVGIVWDLAWDMGERMTDVANNGPQLLEYYEEVPWMAPIHILAPITLDFWGPIAG